MAPAAQLGRPARASFNYSYGSHLHPQSQWRSFPEPAKHLVFFGGLGGVHGFFVVLFGVFINP